MSQRRKTSSNHNKWTLNDMLVLLWNYLNRLQPQFPMYCEVWGSLTLHNLGTSDLDIFGFTIFWKDKYQTVWIYSWYIDIPLMLPLWMNWVDSLSPFELWNKPLIIWKGVESIRKLHCKSVIYRFISDGKERPCWKEWLLLCQGILCIVNHWWRITLRW